MIRAFPPSRRGFSMFELLVTLVVLILLLGLLLPAVQKVREAASRIQCSNNLKQLGLATINCADTNAGKLPPAVGSFPNATSDGTLFFYVLPCLEQDNLYQSAGDGKGNFSVWTNEVYARRVKVFECPSDGSASDGRLFNDWLAPTSYAANFLAFGTNSVGFPAFFTDGTSNTIMFTERYQICNQTPNAWAYSGESDWAPVFAYSSYAKFQNRPARDQCNPALPQAIHAGGIQVGMADGSVRTVANEITAQTWYFACTPNGGEVLGADW
jgi:prepilin-type processing-associated H-X9-DG protein